MDDMIDLAGATAVERDAFLAIYEEALPPSERKPREVILAQAARDDFRVWLWRESGAVRGFAVVYLDKDFALLDYLGVRHGERGRGTGARIMAAVLAGIGERVLVIEVDSDREASADSELRTRRRGFYERAGARRIDGIAYRMPQVGQGVPPAMDLMVHSRGRPLIVTPVLARDWIRAIYTGVYGVDIMGGELDEMLRNMTAGAAA